MGKPTICIGENKDADQLRGNREADQRLCFRYSDSTIPLLLKSEISSFYSFLCLYRPVCVGPVRKPHYWFSHEVAQIFIMIFSNHNEIIPIYFLWENIYLPSMGFLYRKSLFKNVFDQNFLIC